jgi:ATP phosphoribosyltransferase regulatory subunit
MSATKLPLTESSTRLFYIQNSFAAAAPAFGKAGEFTQAGIELIGDATQNADAEVIALAVKALKTCGLETFTIDIGQVAFFKALIRECDMTEEQADALRHAVDSKDSAAIAQTADKLGLSGTLRQQILALPGLFGSGNGVFERALALSDHPDCVSAVENLRSVYALLESYGMADYLSIDFGMLHDIAYYSGIIFRGITPEIGFPVVSGGRYDDLLSKFGTDAPATGFALGIKRVMIAMERQGLLSGYYTTKTVVSCDIQSCAAAFNYVESERQGGRRTLYKPGISRDALVKMKSDNDAKTAVYFDADGRMETL